MVTFCCSAGMAKSKPSLLAVLSAFFSPWCGCLTAVQLITWKLSCRLQQHGDVTALCSPACSVAHVLSLARVVILVRKCRLSHWNPVALDFVAQFRLDHLDFLALKLLPRSCLTHNHAKLRIAGLRAITACLWCGVRSSDGSIILEGGRESSQEKRLKSQCPFIL